MVVMSRVRARFRVGVLVASVAFLTFTLGAMPASKADDPTRWSLSQWISWRDSQIRRILTPTFKADGEMILNREDVILRSVDAYKVLMPVLERPDFLGDPDRGRALGNFTSFVRAQGTMAIYDETRHYDHLLGFNVPDKLYWRNSASELQFPPLLRSKEFLTAMDAPSQYRDAVTLVEKQNETLPENRKWIVLTYRSRFLKSSDTTTYGRLLIVVPNESAPNHGVIDRWIQFALVTPAAGRISDAKSGLKTRSVSMVVVHRKSSVSDDNKAYIVDFMRDKDEQTGEYSIVPTMLEKKNPSKNCYDCHKSPVLPIHPKTRYDFDEQGRLIAQEINSDRKVELLNDRISEYGQVEFGSMDTNAFGPSIGQPRLVRTREFIREASGQPLLSEESCDRIRDAMQCSKCHDSVGKLNYPQAVKSNVANLVFEEKQSLVQSYIENGWMPPKTYLSSAERHALWLCLDKEYFDPRECSGRLVDWLKGATADSND